MKQGLENALETFQWASKNVPAYKKFLSEQNIVPEKIKTDTDFSMLPTVEKSNYFKKYPFLELFPEEILPPMVSASSGSSGVPFYWPRGYEQEDEAFKIHARIFKEIFGIADKKVLVVISFAMGVWIGGTLTLECCRRMAKKNKNLSIITPGIDKDDALLALKNLAPMFDIVILAGYPPFLMDIISSAAEAGIDLKKLNLKMLFAGESYSEKWRDLIHKAAGVEDALCGSVGIYGTADAGVMGHETPLSVYLRRYLAENEEFQKELFGFVVSKLPTVVQYYPEFKYFEEDNGSLVFTSRAGIPIVRYNLKDKVKIFEFEQLKKVLEKFGVWEEIRSKGLEKWKMPFVFLFGRDDVAATFYALNIYPESIKAALETREVVKSVSGKFVVKVACSENGLDQKLNILVELQKSLRPSVKLKKRIGTAVFMELLRSNTEFKKLHSSLGEKAAPKIKLYRFGDNKFEIKKCKHKWVQR